MYLASLVRSTVALHNLIDNKLTNQKAEEDEEVKAKKRAEKAEKVEKKEEAKGDAKEVDK